MSAGPLRASRRLAFAFTLGLLVASSLCVGPIPALAGARRVPTPKPSVPRAPAGPALGAGGVTVGEASASAPSSGGDPLTGNGLDSPLCRASVGLSATQRRSCETDSFVAAPDPTNNYAFDVNIDTGLDKWGNDMSATIDDFAQFGWMALVSATHGLVVMFEWCYSLNLLSGALLGQVSVALREARSGFTEPWLAFVLAVASMLVMYHGLVKRRVAETMGQALAMVAMMGGGLWVIADPAGTVGAVEKWSNQAGLGAMAVAANGTPRDPARTLADNMQALFTGAIDAPWCYLEFGDVGWCDEPSRLDGALRQAGLAIAKSEQQKSGCRAGCSADAATGSRDLSWSAQLLGEARTNGELFLALPANEQARNSATKEGTLLHVLCGGGQSADDCTGPTAPQAEFRTQKGTGSRVIGLFAIWLGALGMLLLLGFLGLRLLGAAVTGLFFLLLAPAAVLAPALGDGGRSAFRGWALKLLEATVAKLTYSFLLGVVLLVTKLLWSLTILGWWEQWLLVSAFWWGIFLKRHHTLGWAQGAVRGSPPTPHRSMARRVGEALETPRALVKPHLVRRNQRQPAPETDPPKKRSQAPATLRSGSQDPASANTGAISREEMTKAGPAQHQDRDESWEFGNFGAPDIARGESFGKQLGTGEQTHANLAHARVGHTLADRQRHASSPSDAGGQAAERHMAARDGQLERVRHERQQALAGGDIRRVALLTARERRIEDEQSPYVAGSAMSASASGKIDPGRALAVSMPGSPASEAGRAQTPRPGPVSGASSRLTPGGGTVPPDRRLSAERPQVERSSVMDDAREVAARRKRQLGWETHSRGPGNPRGPRASE